MIDDVYNAKILGFAGNIGRIGRLDRPDATATAHSKLCGSTVTVDLRLEEGRIAAFGQDVKACALGQASASVLGRHVIGASRAEIAAARDQLHAMLTAGGPEPGEPFAELAVLMPARDYRNRHASILLAWDATLAAFDEAVAAA